MGRLRRWEFDPTHTSMVETQPLAKRPNSPPYRLGSCETATFQLQSTIQAWVEASCLEEEEISGLLILIPLIEGES